MWSRASNALRAAAFGFLVALASASVAFAQINPPAAPGNSSVPAIVTVNTPPNDVTTGPSTCTTTGGCTAFTVATAGSGAVSIQITGSGAGMNFTFQASDDNSNWFTVPCYAPNALATSAVTSGTANGQWYCPIGAFRFFRLNWTGLTSGTVTETLNASAGSTQPPSVTTVAGKNGSNSTPINVNVNGSVIIVNEPSSSNNNSTTITAGGSFQTLLASNTTRKGCMVQNPTTATEVLYVSVGIATGSATTAKSFSLAPGVAFNCSYAGGVVTDNIAVEAATTGHSFVETDQ